MAEKLHFVRYRRPGGNYFDPNTDVRRLVPMLAGAILEGMRDEGCRAEAVDHIERCLNVFEIRLIEDDLPLERQVNALLKALSSGDQEVTALFYRRLSVAFVMVYSLFVRRDAATDEDVLRLWIENVRQSALNERLSTETLQTIRSELGKSSSLLLGSAPSRPVSAVEAGSGDEIPRLKELARQCVQAGPGMSWDALAELCDREFSAGKHSDAEQIALALAYPTYEQPTVEVEADGPEDKAGPAAAPGQPGAVPLDGGTGASRQ